MPVYSYWSLTRISHRSPGFRNENWWKMVVKQPVRYIPGWLFFFELTCETQQDAAHAVIHFADQFLDMCETCWLKIVHADSRRR
jgi:hypothetical protein